MYLCHKHVRSADAKTLKDSDLLIPMLEDGRLTSAFNVLAELGKG